MAKWSVVCHPKDQGGLGLQDLKVKNRTFLGKWIFKFLFEESISVQMCCLRLIGNLLIHIFWAGHMATKKFVFPFVSFSIKDVLEIRFWEDKWLGNATLREQYPVFYNIV